MQRVSDRQKTLAAHGVPISDERLHLTALDFRKLTSVEGRVLVHGEEEMGREAGRNYLLLEGTDGRIHHLYYTPEMHEARSRGGLRTNSFVRFRKLSVNGKAVIEIDELGDAEAMLFNRSYLRQTARALIKVGIIPEQDGWGGWLGRYQTAVGKMVLEQMEHSRNTAKGKASERSHER